MPEKGAIVIVGILETLAIGFVIGFFSPSLRVAALGGVLYWALGTAAVAYQWLDGVNTVSFFLHSIPVGLTTSVAAVLLGFVARQRFRPTASAPPRPTRPV